MSESRNESFNERASRIRPTMRQVTWQETEFYGFIHFSINTFSGKQWGDGTESPLLFDPIQFDSTQWVETFKAAGMKGVILTCKHHDGFCLWPSRFTSYTVASSPWKNGSGDVVREVAKACKENGLKFGIYLSPWDRHEKCYGDTDCYNNFFVDQLKELLTQYGEVFSVWFDGACGEGPNGSIQRYDWDRFYEVIRHYQPNACISVCGPDVRWCGNEGGQTRTSEWSVVSEKMKDVEKTQTHSQKSDDHTSFISRQSSSDENLGDREVLNTEEQLIWYPCEVNVSIRPSWFYEESEDDQVKSVDDLMNIYERTVGGNSTFLLNVPPDKRGLLHENDIRVLKDLGKELSRRYRTNLLEKATIYDADSGELLNDLILEHLLEREKRKAVTSIEMVFQTEEVLDSLVIQENIMYGQQIENFVLEHYHNDNYIKIYEGTVVGYKKIAKFKPARGIKFRIRIINSRSKPVIHFLGLYNTQTDD